MLHEIVIRIKVLITFLWPICLLVVGYFIEDPFMVLYKYDDYSNSLVVLNRDFVSTQSYLDRRSLYEYNSFIFGSSRTMGFTPSKWESLVGKSNHAYVFAASKESLYGIHRKIAFLDEQGAKINNAIVVLCRDFSFGVNENHRGHLFIKHPATSGESVIAFHSVCLGAYLNPKFLFNYYVYRFTGKHYEWMSDYLEYAKEIVYDKRSNQLTRPDIEEFIQKDPEKYYHEKEDLFYPQVLTVDTTARITDQDRERLIKIRSIFQKHKTDFRIVLSPLYEQVQYNDQDLLLLNELFPGRVYDFSGFNKYTEYKQNYYETSHFRPIVGDAILEEIYAKASPDSKNYEQ